jgi:5-deoxy-glucuronate isomerase
VVFITHNVRHALAVGDRFTVLNRGKTLGTAQRGQITPEELQDMMAGGQEMVALAGAVKARSAGRSMLTPVWRLAPGETAEGALEGREAILVLVEGRARMTAAGEEFGEMGERLDVFERRPPHCLYVPPGAVWSAEAATDCALAVCTAPSPGGRPAQRLGPEGIALEERGTGTNTRYINNIAMEGRDVADTLLVTEVFTPAGHWSSYPPHRHDEDDFPRITYLEETYYHRLDPGDGFGDPAGLHRGRQPR